jgi:hypothetical protein
VFDPDSLCSKFQVTVSLSVNYSPTRTTMNRSWTPPDSRRSSIQTSTDPRIVMVVKLDVIMWVKWGFVNYNSIPAGRGDLHITNTRFHSISSNVLIDVYDC